MVSLNTVRIARLNKAGQATKVKCFKSAEFRLGDDHSLSCRKAALQQWLELHDQRLCGAEIQWHQTGLHTPDKTRTRQVSFFQGKRDTKENLVDLMKVKIDSDTGREMITRSFATVEPVFGNLRGNYAKRKTKVNEQWKLYCMMHNIEKLANHG